MCHTCPIIQHLCLTTIQTERIWKKTEWGEKQRPPPFLSRQPLHKHKYLERTTWFTYSNYFFFFFKFKNPSSPYNLLKYNKYLTYMLHVCQHQKPHFHLHEIYIFYQTHVKTVDAICHSTGRDHLFLTNPMPPQLQSNKRSCITQLKARIEKS